MKTLFKQSAIAVALVFAVGAVAVRASYADSTAPVAASVSEQRQVGAFKAIELAGPYHVVIKAQGANTLELSGEPKQLANVETVVLGDTLIVRPLKRSDKYFGFHFGRSHTAVTVHITAAMLQSLKLSGSGDV